MFVVKRRHFITLHVSTFEKWRHHTVVPNRKLSIILSPPEPAIDCFSLASNSSFINSHFTGWIRIILLDTVCECNFRFGKYNLEGKPQFRNDVHTVRARWWWIGFSVGYAYTIVWRNYSTCDGVRSVSIWLEKHKTCLCLKIYHSNSKFYNKSVHSVYNQSEFIWKCKRFIVQVENSRF